jgi:hypothetical protein
MGHSEGGFWGVFIRSRGKTGSCDVDLNDPGDLAYGIWIEISCEGVPVENPSVEN